MELKDARSLSQEAQEDLRMRVVRVVLNNMSQTEAARVFHVSRQSVNKWVNIWHKEGREGLKSKPKGRPRQSRLKPYQAATTVRMISNRCPDQLKFPFALWTREAVQRLLAKKFGVHVSIWTVGRYLKRWGFTPQKPLRRAYEQNPREVRKWLKKEYPQIKNMAKNEGAEIFWGDEMGVRSDHQTGRTYSRRGKTPVILGTGKRFGCNMISVITNRGKLAFMVFEKRFTSEVFIEFLRRLVKHSSRKAFLIVDRHPVHRSKKVNRWLGKRNDRIKMFYLPPYSPELNPDELLNQDVKSNAVGRKRPDNKIELLKNVRSYLRSRQCKPEVVVNYFKGSGVRYAA